MPDKTDHAIALHIRRHAEAVVAYEAAKLRKEIHRSWQSRQLLELRRARRKLWWHLGIALAGLAILVAFQVRTWADLAKLGIPVLAPAIVAECMDRRYKL